MHCMQWKIMDEQIIDEHFRNQLVCRMFSHYSLHRAALAIRLCREVMNYIIATT